MPKAILELEMPDSCLNGCPFCMITGYCYLLSTRNHFQQPVWVPSKGKHADCPLKPVETCKWVLIDDDKGLWHCLTCGAECVIEAGTPTENEIYYCPMCGGRLEGE